MSDDVVGWFLWCETVGEKVLQDWWSNSMALVML